MLHRYGISVDLMTVGTTFQWPQEERRGRNLCTDLQEYGCCAFSFQRVATAALMSVCDIDKAVSVASLSSHCSALGAPSNARNQHVLPCTALWSCV